MGVLSYAHAPGARAAASRWTAPSRLALALALVALASCYSPSLQDCAVTCTNSDQCGPDQTCADGWCTGDETTRCDLPIDADAGPLPGGSELRITISGRGTVELTASGQPLADACVSSEDEGTVCTYPLPAGTWLTMNQKSGGGWKFDRWESFGCGVGRPKSCVVRVGDTSTSVGARFFR
jgi:hypothetical protein